MSRSRPFPALRSDLDLLAQAAPGRPDRHLLHDPVRGVVLEMTAKEAFLCRQLDGQTGIDDIRRRFRETFSLEISTDNVGAFIETLRREGLLAGEAAPAARREWERLKSLPIDADRVAERLARLLDPWIRWYGKLVVALILLLGFGLLIEQWPVVWHTLSHLLTHLEAAGHGGFFVVLSFQSVVQIAVFFTVLPFVRELVKAAWCRRHGARVPEIRYGWFLRFIPRCVAGIHGLARFDKAIQIRILAAGLMVELLAFCLGLICAALVGPANPLRDLFNSLAIGAALRFLFTANPFGKLDGNALLGLMIGEPDLHYRSVAMFRAWLFRRPQPEPATPARRRKLIAWGFACDLVLQGLTVAFLWAIGYILIQWMGGVGAILLLVLVYLKYERNLRDLLATRKQTTSMGRTETSSPRTFWLRTLVIVVLVVLVGLIPYPFEVSGEFRIQPVDQREIRTELAGLIDRIEVVEGGDVEAGQVIARLSTRNLDTDIEKSRAALRREREILRAKEAGARPEDIAKLQQAVHAAEVKLTYSEESLKRTAQLHERGHMSEQDYQNMLMVRDLDRENLELARLTLIAAEAGYREEEIEAQRAVVESLEITLRHLEDDLARTVIRSPIAGKVSTLYLQGRIGQQTTPGDVIAVVDDLSRPVVRIALPEAHVGHVEPGARVRVRPWAFANRIFEGKVTAILPVVVDKSQDLIQKAAVEQERGMVRNLNMPEDRIVPVLAEIDNPDDLFRSDMTGFAKISAGWRPLGYAFLHPVFRFVTVRVWSWIP